MKSKSLVSNPVDPLHPQLGVSLFPRTTRVPSPAEPKDLETIHQLMKSVEVLSSAEKVLEGAKAIVDGSSKLLESGYPKFMESVGIEWDTFAHEGKENVQVRRPGLRGKRARFTLKTNASTRPSVNLEPTLDFEQPCDAEEFFNAFEKTEEAKRELQRLNGGTDFHKYDQPTNKRSRRPGILGYRKSYIYKHRESLDNNNSQMLSQDTQELNLPYESQKEEADTELEAQETNVSASATEIEDEYNNILDELFSKNSEDLGGDCGVSLIENRLSIKPISLDTFLIPGLDVVGRTDFMAMREKLPKEKKTLANISTLARRLSGGTDVKQKSVGGSPISPMTSPTPSNVTVGSISLMKRRSSLSSPLRDPFSPLNIGMSEFRKAFSGDDIDKQPPQLPVRNKLSCSGNLEPRVEDILGSPITDNVDLQTGMTRASESPINCFSVKNLKPQAEDGLRRSPTPRVDFQTLISQPPQLPVRNELSCSGNLEPQVEDILGSPITDNVDLQTGVTRASESPINCFSVKNLEPQAEDGLRRSPTPCADFQTLILQPPQLPVQNELSCSGNLEPWVEDILESPITDNVDLQTGVTRASESPINCFSVKNLEPQAEDGLRRSPTPRADFQTLISRALDSPDGRFLDKSLGQGSTDDDILPRESQSGVSERGTVDGLHENTTLEESINVPIAPDRTIENVTERSDAAVHPSQFNSHTDDSAQTESDTGVHQSHEVKGMPLKLDVHTNPEVNVSQLQAEENQTEGQPNTAATEGNHVDAPSITADIMTMKTSKVQPKKVTRKRPHDENRELKALNRRKSFAEAGTYIESGVRRSKRIKTRPLEYWKGERLLYGRINESVKLVGLKYMSPSRGERDLKVKPYISDDYKEIIDLASRY